MNNRLHRTNDLLRTATENVINEERRDAYYKSEDIDGELCDSYPDYNEWVKALEGDPDYIAKVEKQLDRELGKDRLF